MKLFLQEKVFVVFKRSDIIDSIWSVRELAENRLKIEKEENGEETAFIKTFVLDRDDS